VEAAAARGVRRPEVVEVRPDVDATLAGTPGAVDPRAASWLAGVLDAAQEGICGLDAKGCVVFANARAAEVMRCAVSDLVGRRGAELWDLEVPGTGARPPSSIESRLERPDGVVLSIRVAPAGGQAGEARAGYAVSLLDISRESQLAREVEQLGLYDSLTGLPNRTLLENRLDHALERRSRFSLPIALMLVDVDRFRHVNESFGHAVADTLLTMVAQRICDQVRPEDTIARLGGDEFGIILEGVPDVAAATTVAERVMGAFAEPFRIADTSLTLTASVGIALNSQAHHAAQDLMRFAGVALYRAKDTVGLGSAVFDPTKDFDATRRSQFESELRAAIADGQLCLHYHPIVDLETGVIVGAEALIRWNHRTRGVVYPGEFLALADEGGILPTIGKWVLETGIDDLARWIRRGLVHDSFTLDVNVSASELRPELVSVIGQILESAGVPAARLQLEVSEAAALRATQVITDLRDSGVAVALDDIGGGAASLGHMVKLKVDAIKIDRLFVGGLGSVSRDTAVVEAIQLMSNRLELLTIAEGIETEDQLRRLIAVGCRLGQGYLFGKPCARAPFQKVLEQKILLPAREVAGTDPMRG